MSDNEKKVVSIKTLAAHLNMSHATVSRALNNKSVISEATKERVREAAEKFGYVANSGARLVRGMPGQLIGLIIPDVQNDFYSTVAKILAKSCAKQGLELILAISDDNSELEALHIRSMLESRVSGIIITPTISLKQQEANFLKNVPCLQIIRRHNLIQAKYIGIDDQQGIKLATEHLLELGHRDIGFIGGSRELSTSINRFSGYQSALADYKIEMTKQIITFGPPRPEFGRAAMEKIMQLKQRPTAFVLGSSQLTLGALQAVRDFSLTVPQDISIVGYGDPPWFELSAPPITTVNLPVEALSQKAAAELFNLIKGYSLNGKEPYSQTIFSPTLKIRQSTERLKRKI